MHLHLLPQCMLPWMTGQAHQGLSPRYFWEPPVALPGWQELPGVSSLTWVAGAMASPREQAPGHRSDWEFIS